MRALLAAQLLSVWEKGLYQRPAERALALLAAADADSSTESLAQLSIGQRDARLLKLREWTFGPRWEGVACCPHCSERSEINANVADLQTESSSPLVPTGAHVREPPGVFLLQTDGYEVRFRLPNTDDLVALMEVGDSSACRRRLLQRCVDAASHRGQPIANDSLPESTFEAMAARMAELDPQADVQLAIRCPACGHDWLATFDIVSFFWTEINAWANRLLREVHTLASAYGWREADILSMSPMRRQIYLNMVSR